MKINNILIFSTPLDTVKFNVIIKWTQITLCSKLVGLRYNFISIAIFPDLMKGNLMFWNERPIPSISGSNTTA